MPLGRWARVVYKLSQLIGLGGGKGVWLFSSFLLFRTRCVRYLMAFLCIYFQKDFDGWFWDF